MDDYILRGDVQDIVFSHFCASSDETETALNSIVEEVKALPAADVHPVKYAEWDNLVRCGFGSVEATCRACRKTLIYKSWWHFCPNCGAQIKKENV